MDPGALPEPPAGAERDDLAARAPGAELPVRVPQPGSIAPPAPVGSWDLDLAAASLRIDTGDTDALFEALGGKLERILGGRAQVTREGGLRRRSRRVVKIVVDAGGTRLEASRSRAGASFSEAHAVRGITLRTAELAADEWLDRLVAAVEAESTRSADVRAALGRMLE